jgi:ATP-dependent Clp protease, protease subunit
MLITLAGIPEHVRNAISSKTFKAFINEKDDEAEILIYEQIGKDWDGTGVGASDVAAFLSSHRGMPVNARINSPGGLAYDGITIHNAFVSHDAPVNTIVEGLAASAATIISRGASNGGKAKMAENASYFVHRASGLAWGNVDVMAEVSEWLTKIDEQIARTYAAHVHGKSWVQMLNVMKGSGKKDGTVMTASEAKEMGFIDEIISVKGAKSKNDGGDIAEEIRQRQERLLADEMSECELEAVRNRLRILQLDEVV